MIKLSKLLPNESSSRWEINKEPNPCLWKGVSCTPDSSSITHLCLSNFSLSTSYPLPDLCQIETLQSLDLSNNHLTSIPDEFLAKCGEIEGLKLLNFSMNKLSGLLRSFSGFSNLEILDMSYNNLSGTINSQLERLAALKSLNLSYNRLNGPIPTQLGNRMALNQLVLSTNFFEGKFPENISLYQNLTLIDFSVNRLSGPLPNRIVDLSKLEILILSLNDLSGEIPVALSNISTLYRFAANQNKFRGSISLGITNFLRYLDLSYNKLNGSIPSSFLSQPNLLTVDLSNNSFEGSVPTNISSSLVRLRLGSNLISGEVPDSLCKTFSNLTYLEIDNNRLTGSIPPELGLCQKLALLNLAQNKLSGKFPSPLCNLSQLQVLKLQFNNLDGAIPIQIGQLQKLSQLNMSWNSLTSSIPSSISSLQDLRNLNLQSNNLNGSIPNSLSSLNSLIELKLGNNQLSGEIPSMPKNLQIALNLSSNHLEGLIPDKLSQLYGLEVLDLSDNKLSGEIPSSLTDMEALMQLILSNNQLSGVIPKFQSHVEVVTSGNALVNITETSSRSPKRRKSSVAVAIAIALSASVLIVGVFILTAVLIKRRLYRINKERINTTEDLPLPKVIQGNVLTPNGIHRSNIDFLTAMEAVSDPVLLKTRFSTYYKAVMPSGKSYFVKKINWSDKIFQIGSPEKIWEELKHLGNLRNSNLMTPLAYFLTVDTAFLFYEFAEKGTLFDVLHGNGLDWSSRYSIAIGLAQGLASLHGCTSGPILLLDLSSKSIMLKSLREPLIGDIELYKVIDPSKSTGSLSTVAGSVGYIPPEYPYTMRVTMAGNIYSFGVILLEILTGKPAVSGGTELTKWVLSTNSAQQDNWEHILDFTVSKTSEAVHRQMLAVLKVALVCVSVSPEARPKMKSVLRMLLNAR